MSDFVKADDVFVNEHATSREEVLRFLSQQKPRVSPIMPMQHMRHLWLVKVWERPV